MYGKFGEFFPDFFDLLNKYKPDFFWKELSGVVSGQCAYCITLSIHVLFHNFWMERQDVRRMLLMMHLMPFICHVLITAATIFFTFVW